ncbi:hypothetical protein KCU59_g95, partial [Aureobasidium melanogenum]
LEVQPCWQSTLPRALIKDSRLLRRSPRPPTTNATATWVACIHPADVRVTIMGLPDLDAFSEEMEIMRRGFKSAYCRNDASKQSRVRALICVGFRQPPLRASITPASELIYPHS